jgi:hypothetical protein
MFWVYVKKKYCPCNSQYLLVQDGMRKSCWEQIPDGPDQFEKLSETITLFSKYMVTQRKLSESRFDSREGQVISLCPTASRPTLRATQFHREWVQG